MEYYNKPDKTKEAFHFDSEGQLWFRSGDIGRIDSEGYVYIMDRAKDLIIRGGENISCSEVEAAVYEHPAVDEVAAFGFPHVELGEEVAIAVCYKNGAQKPTAAELISFARTKLAKYKVPSRVFEWEGELPRGATGKIQKRDIRERVAPPKPKL